MTEHAWPISIPGSNIFVLCSNKKPKFYSTVQFSAAVDFKSNIDVILGEITESRFFYNVKITEKNTLILSLSVVLSLAQVSAICGSRAAFSLTKIWILHGLLPYWQ